MVTLSRVLAIPAMVFFVAVLPLAGCSSPDETVLRSQLTTTTHLPFEIADLQLGWGETATINGVAALTASVPQLDPSAQPVSSALPDNVVFYCMVTLKNIGDEPLLYDQSDFQLVADYEAWVGGAGGLVPTVSPPLLSGTLSPGETVTGAVPFQISREGVPTIRELFFHGRGNELVTTIVHWQTTSSSSTISESSAIAAVSPTAAVAGLQVGAWPAPAPIPQLLR